MKERVFKNLLSKFISKDIDPNGESSLEQFDIEMINKNRLVELGSKDDVWNKLNSSINRKKIFHLPKTFLRAVATLALFLTTGSIGYYFFSTESKVSIPAEWVEYHAENGQKMEVRLSDGSKVKLNSGSWLRFPKQFNDSIRPVELGGEAFFEVARNTQKPFTIKSGNLDVMVLGTSFNVNAYPENKEIAVTVATGKVKLTSNDGKEIFLERSEQGIYDKDVHQISKNTIDLKNFLEWRDGILRFENTSLTTMTQKLSRWYGIEFNFQDTSIRNCRFTGMFKDEKLETVLEGLVFVKKGLKYSRNMDGTITLSGQCTN